MKKLSILLLLMLAVSIFQLAAMQQSTTLSSPQKTNYSTEEARRIEEIQKTLPAGWVINHETEIEEAIDTAVDEAVKIVVIEKEPLIEYWKARANGWEREAAKKEEANRIQKIIVKIGIPAAFIAGAATRQIISR